MQLADLGDHRLGAQLQPPRTARMPPGRGLSLRQLQRAGGRAELVQKGVEISLQGEQILRGPVVPPPGRVRRQHGRHGGALVLRPVAGEHRAGLEQGHVREAARGVSPDGLDQRRQDRWTHAVELGGDRVGQPQLGLAASEQHCRLVGDERPGHRLAVA